jgi:hypothetical protein
MKRRALERWLNARGFELDREGGRQVAQRRPVGLAPTTVTGDYFCVQRRRLWPR